MVGTSPGQQKAAQAFSYRLAVPILGWYGPTRAGLRTHCLLKAINWKQKLWNASGLGHSSSRRRFRFTNISRWSAIPSRAFTKSIRALLYSEHRVSGLIPALSVRDHVERFQRRAKKTLKNACLWFPIILVG